MDELIRSAMHDALEIEAPAAGLRYRVINSLPARERRQSEPSRPAFEWAAGLIALLLAAAVVAGLLYTRGALVVHMPAHPIHGPVSRGYSGMVTTTAGWEDIGEGNLIRTTDGGRHWTDVTPASFVHSINVGEFFLDGTHAWLTGTPNGFDTTRSMVVFATSDGGQSWHHRAPLSIPSPTPVVIGSPPPSLFFLDAEHGWLLVSAASSHIPADFLFRSSDGGLTWQPAADSSTQPLLKGMSQVTFSSAATGWSFDGWWGAAPPVASAVLVTHDGGTSWETQRLPPLSDCPCFVVDVQFFGPSDGMLIALGADSIQTLFVTSDGGNTWRIRSLPGKVQVAVAFVDADHGWTIAGQDALLGSAKYVPLYRTDDGGRTWTPVPNNLLLETKSAGIIGDFYFVDELDGFAARFQSQVRPTEVLKTVDGGRTWTVISSTG